MIEIQLERVRLELKRIREERTERKQEREIELYELNTKYTDTKRKFSSLEKKGREHFRGFHHYTDALKSVSTSHNAQSSYILTLEAKLLREMHYMLNIDNQLTLIKHQSNKTISVMRRCLTREREKASSLECQLINRIFREDKEKAEKEAKYSNDLDESTRNLESFFMEESQRSMASLGIHQVLEASSTSLHKLESLAEGDVLKSDQVVSEIDKILMMLESVRNLNSPTTSKGSIVSKSKTASDFRKHNDSDIADMLHNLPWAK